MKARKFVLIYFKTVKATQGKKNTARYKVNKENENHGSAKQTWQIHWRLYFKAVFLCERVVAVCDLEVVLAIEQANNGCMINNCVLSYTLLNTLQNFM